MRTLLVLILSAFLASAPALAADGAQSRAIGYSADGKYFAFEQFGVQDGSGFPYWDVFVLDLAANDWVKGTPVRILVEDEEQRLPEARRQAMAKAGPVIERLAITEPADLLARQSLHRGGAGPDAGALRHLPQHDGTAL